MASNKLTLEPAGAAALAASRTGGRGRGARPDRQWLVPYRFLLPYLLVFAIFWFWPLIDSFFL